MTGVGDGPSRILRTWRSLPGIARVAVGATALLGLLASVVARDPRQAPGGALIVAMLALAVLSLTLLTALVLRDLRTSRERLERLEHALERVQGEARAATAAVHTHSDESQRAFDGLHERIQLSLDLTRLRAEALSDQPPNVPPDEAGSARYEPR